jgi:hypothetical protein
MKIDRIYITTYARDVRQTRICIASIRYFHPDTDIYLIVDEKLGPMPERELANAWGVKRLKTSSRYYLATMGQLEPFYTEPGIRFFQMDTDIVFVGPMLELFGPHDEDIVVQKEFVNEEAYNRHWINRQRITELDKDFKYPEWFFNSGQWAGVSGIFSESDFKPWLTDDAVPRLKEPKLFYQSQGLLNYVIIKAAQEGRITMGYENVAVWAGNSEELAKISLDDVRDRRHPPLMVHWAGIKKPKLEDYPRSDLFRFFEEVYYSRINGGKVKRWWDMQWEPAVINARRAMRAVMRKVAPGKVVGGVELGSR